MKKETTICEFCKEEKEDFEGVAFGKLICTDCGKKLYSTNDTNINGMES